MRNTLTLAQVRTAVDAARATLARMGCYAAPVPSSLDVMKALRDAGWVADQQQVLDACALLAIRLADSDPPRPQLVFDVEGDAAGAD